MKKFSALLAIGLFAAAGYAAQQTINVGSSANDGTGDTLRGAFIKVNDNFTELYNEHSGVVDFGDTGTITNVAGIGIPDGSKIVFQGTTVNTELYGGGYGDSITISQGLNVRGTAVNIGALGIVTRGPSYNIANGSASWFGWSDNLDGAAGTKDLKLYRDAAGTLAQRNGVNAQTSRTYGTYTDASNFSRISVSHDGSSTGTIALESAGTGSANQSLKLQVAGNGALYVDGDTAGNARGNNAVDLQIGRSNSGHVASGAYSSLVGGLYNTASGQSSSIVGGAYNASFGHTSTVLGGNNNHATAMFSSTVGGYQSAAYLFGQHAYASGLFVFRGDAQGSRLVARNTTTGSSADLFLDGVDDRLVLPANTSWKFRVGVTARSTDGGTGAEEVASYEFKGTITRDGANNTALPWAVTKTVEGETDPDWDCNVSADDTNEALSITVSSDDANTVRWVAVIELVEVGG